MQALRQVHKNTVGSTTVYVYTNSQVTMQADVCLYFRNFFIERFIPNSLQILLVKNFDKKFELMLTRRAKTYSSSCSQTVRLSPAISSQANVCAAAEDRKNQ